MKTETENMGKSKVILLDYTRKPAVLPTKVILYLCLDWMGAVDGTRDISPV